MDNKIVVTDEVFSFSFFYSIREDLILIFFSTGDIDLDSKPLYNTPEFIQYIRRFDLYHFSKKERERAKKNIMKNPHFN